MQALQERHVRLMGVLESLGKSLTIFDAINRGEWCGCSKVDPKEEYRIHRDSVIQRFKWSIDLLCKYLTNYLEVTQVTIGINVPGEVVRTACAAKILGEDEAENILAMIKSRNMTSHMYVEEVAELLAAKIPEYHAVMCVVAQRLIIKE